MPDTRIFDRPMAELDLPMELLATIPPEPGHALVPDLARDFFGHTGYATAISTLIEKLRRRDYHVATKQIPASRDGMPAATAVYIPSLHKRRLRVAAEDYWRRTYGE